MCACGWSCTQPWWRPCSVAWIVVTYGTLQAVGERRRGVRHEPVVAVDEVVRVLLREHLAGREHVLVHLLDPRHEAVEVARPARLAHAVHGHAAALLRAGALAFEFGRDAAREHVDGHALAHQRLRELAHVPREPALDHGRVLPGEDQHAIAHSRDPISRRLDTSPPPCQLTLRAAGRRGGARAPRCESITDVAPPPVLFYLGLMSPYSWLAAERIEQLLPDARWRVVLAGVVFAAHGRTSWGLTDEREQGLADCEARAAARGLGPLVWPERWPSNDLQAARGATFAARSGLERSFALEAMRLAFLEGAELSERVVVLEAGRRCGIDAAELERALEDPSVKQELRDVNDEALAAGVFGVPTLLAAGELFWGDDRLEDAVAATRP